MSYDNQVSLVLYSSSMRINRRHLSIMKAEQESEAKKIGQV